VAIKTVSIGTWGNYKDFLLEHVVTIKTVSIGQNKVLASIILRTYYTAHVLVETVYVVNTCPNRVSLYSYHMFQYKQSL
jgi:hypothetical protein